MVERSGALKGIKHTNTSDCFIIYYQAFPAKSLGHKCKCQGRLIRSWHKIEGAGLYSSHCIHMKVNLYRAYAESSALSEKLDNIGLCIAISCLPLKGSPMEVHEDMMAALEEGTPSDRDR